ncbi:MAG: hypothetical protein WC375_06095 [Methanomassiliicoccales archaeon]
MKPETSKFVSKVKDELQARGIELYLSNHCSVNFNEDHTRVSGYWDEEAKKMTVAVGMSERNWVGSLVHEYAHFCQYVEKCPVWRHANRYNSLWAWLIGNKDLQTDALMKEIKAVRNMELDCERRTVKLIKKYHLPVPIEWYIRGASAYIYYYNFLPECRKWFSPKMAPCNIVAVMNAMPTSLRGQFKTLPNDIAKIYRRYYL